MSSIRISVPATTANLGPGFDCLGAALTLPNHFTFSRLPEAIAGSEAFLIEVQGAEAARVGRGVDNLVYQAFCRFYERLGQPVPKVKIEIALGVPLARGLGSSATAIVAGLVGANALAGSPWEVEQIAALATEIEGHPDNVVPALLGGCCLAASGIDLPWEVCDLEWHSDVIPVVAIPDFELSTAEARSVLPSSYSRADAIFNMAHLGLLIRGLETGRSDWLKSALQDRIHQPYRTRLIQGFDVVRAAAVQAGAHGLVISGAGPTLLALALPTTANAVATAMVRAWTEAGVLAEVKVLAIDRSGAQITQGS